MGQLVCGRRQESGCRLPLAIEQTRALCWLGCARSAEPWASVHGADKRRGLVDFGHVRHSIQ